MGMQFSVVPAHTNDVSTLPPMYTEWDAVCIKHWCSDTRREKQKFLTHFVQSYLCNNINLEKKKRYNLNLCVMVINIIELMKSHDGPCDHMTTLLSHDRPCNHMMYL